MYAARVAPSSVVTPTPGIVMPVCPFMFTSNGPGTLLTTITATPPLAWQLEIMDEK
jgi:hypothetical protein